MDQPVGEANDGLAVRNDGNSWLKGLVRAIVVCVSLYVAYHFTCNYHGHSAVGAYAHEALLERDAKRLLSLVAPEEVRANGLTEQNLQRFIDDYVFRGFNRVEVSEIYGAGPDFAAPTSHWYRDYRVDDGRTMHIGLIARREGEIVYLIDYLVVARAMLEHPEAMNSLVVQAEVIERNIDVLNSTGVKGVCIGKDFETWQEYAKSLRDYAKKQTSAR